MRTVVDEHLRNAQEAKLPLLLSAPHLGQEPLHGRPVRFGRDAVELEDIYVVHAEPLQAALQRLGQRAGRAQRQFARLVDGGMELGSQHVAVAGHVPERAAQNGLALAVGGGGIEQVDAEVQRPPHHPDGSGRGHAALSAPVGSDRRCPARPPTPGDRSARTADTACPSPPSRRPRLYHAPAACGRVGRCGPLPRKRVPGLPRERE